MEAPDIFRAALISLAALLIGTMVFGLYAAWRDRNLPVPRRAPFSCVVLFAASYVLLLVQMIIDRWNNLGQQIGPAAIVAMCALLLNGAALVALVRSALPDHE